MKKLEINTDDLVKEIVKRNMENVDLSDAIADIVQEDPEFKQLVLANIRQIMTEKGNELVEKALDEYDIINDIVSDDDEIKEIISNIVKKQLRKKI